TPARVSCVRNTFLSLSRQEPHSSTCCSRAATFSSGKPPSKRRSRSDGGGQVTRSMAENLRGHRLLFLVAASFQLAVVGATGGSPVGRGRGRGDRRLACRSGPWSWRQAARLSVGAATGEPPVATTNFLERIRLAPRKPFSKSPFIPPTRSVLAVTCAALDTW